MEPRLQDDDMAGITQEEVEWKRKNAEKSQAIEKLGHGLSHLLSDYDSPQEEETSEIEEFKLPDKVNRSQMSSSSRDQPYTRDRKHITYQSTPCRKSRGQGRNQEQAVTLFRAPTWINLQGPLAQTNDFIMYYKIRNELEYHRKKHPSADLFSAVRSRFEKSRRDDMAMMSLIQGTAAARYLTGNTHQALTEYKQLQREMHRYHLTNPGIAAAQVHWYMCNYYMYNSKPGLAHSAMQAAVSCIQHHAPSAWTGPVCGSQGVKYDRLAQVSPRHRREHQDLALWCYTSAIEHYLHQPCQEEDYLYYPILYTTYIIHIKLDMPTVYTIMDFCASHIVYHRLRECVVTQGQLTAAQDLLRNVTPHINTLTAGWRPGINERVLICAIFLNIRLTQLAINDKEYKSGLGYITTGAKLYEDWCDIESIYNARCTSLALFKRFPHLVRDTKKVLDSLHDRLALMPWTRPTPHPESPPDSLSSELSDAPPSGLKQLTDLSQRQEKQARRNAYEFPYSSGDIHTRSQDDVSSD